MGIRTLDFDKLSPRLKKLIAYAFEKTYPLDGSDRELEPTGGIGLTTDDLFYVLNMAAKAEMAEQAEEVEP